MTAGTLTRTALEELVNRFMDAFNRDDLDAVMSFMADDALYDEFNGKRNYGKSAIREAFVPQFRGDYGVIRFHTEDLFVDPETGKALVRWRCRIARSETVREWRGLDVLHFDNGLLTEKHTYAKTEVLLLKQQDSGT